ncbi:MAG: peptidyl-prolyl cis-trans isomerase, partial [Myxococcaceae bacterium]|nr:peptidyl-prolyl cis-trans isomerase [Myxococcaceae bacterium]
MITSRCLAALALTSLALACNDPPGTVKVELKRKGPAGKSVATYGAETITDAELATRFAELNPYTRARYQTLEQKREYLDGLVRYELLAREAARRNLQNDPEVVEAMKRVMVQRLIKTEIEDKPGTVSAEAIQRYYDAHQGDYVKPAMTRLRHVFLKAENRAKADEALKKALALAPLDYAAFSLLARESSEEPRTQPIEGDLRFLTDDELSKQYGPELVTAAAELKQVGEVYPKLVETKAGFHVIKLEGRQVALDLAVDQVKQSIESTLA